jgi:hypothetical protein
MPYVVYVIQFNIFAFVIAMLILLNEKKTKNMFFTQKIFISLVCIAMLLLASDSVSWIINGKTGNINFFLNKSLNFILFLMSIVPAALWYIYVDFQIYRDMRRIKKAIHVLSFAVVGNTVLSVISLFNGWYFYIDASNIYHRGPLYLLNFFICFSVLIYTSLFTVVKHKKTEKRIFKTMVIYPLPQIA